MVEQTLVLIKPDHVNLAERILSDLDRCGTRIATVMVDSVPRSVIESHYSVHREKSFFSYMVDALSGRPFVAAVYEGEGILDRIRQAIGSTDPSKAARGTIRGVYGADSLERAVSEARPVKNVVHASDSPSEFQREFRVWRQYLGI